MIWDLKTIAAILITAVIAYGAHYIDVTRIQDHQRAELLAQKEVMIAQCMTAQQTTETANAKLSKDNAGITKRLNALLLQHSSECVHSSSSAGKAGNGPGHAGADVSGSWLLQYAGECEGYRSTVNTLQTFIQEERK